MTEQCKSTAEKTSEIITVNLPDDDRYFPINGKIGRTNLIPGPHSGLRIEFTLAAYEQAIRQAVEEFPNDLDFASLRRLDLLDPTMLTNTDIINLASGKAFSRVNDQRHFALCVRYLSDDLPAARLSDDELRELEEALLSNGDTTEAFKRRVFAQLH